MHSSFKDKADHINRFYSEFKNYVNFKTETGFEEDGLGKHTYKRDRKYGLLYILITWI